VCVLYTDSIREVVSKCILFSGMDFREREVVVDAMEQKNFNAVRYASFLHVACLWVPCGAAPLLQFPDVAADTQPRAPLVHRMMS